MQVATPLRLTGDGKLVTPATFRFYHWFSSVLRRISLLTAFHSDTPLEIDFAGLTHAAWDVSLTEIRLRWQEWTRFSGRQQKAIQMGGMVGTFELSNANLSPFWPYLWLGQWTHTGKGAVMGLGQYRLSTNGSLLSGPSDWTDSEAR